MRPLFIFLSLSLMLMPAVALAAPPAQAPAGEPYIVQADDWLSKIAQKYYDDIFAYPQIVEATNAKAAEDDSFAPITNPDVIEIGQKLWVPIAPGEGAEPVLEPLPVVGIYKVMLPGASSPGLDMTLYLDVDQTVRQVSDYLNDEPPLVEVGSWEQTGDQVQLSLTGQAERTYDEPAVITLQIDENGLTTTPPGPEAGRWTYLPFGALALEKQPVPYDPQAAAQLLAERGPLGFYKAFLPSASCCGRDITLLLGIENQARLETDFLNGEPPIIDQGSWSVAEDGQIAITLAQAESPLDLVVSEGLLVTAPDEDAYGQAGLELYRFEVIARNSLQLPE